MALRHNPHVDTEAVIDIVRRELGAVSHQATYDVLRALSGAALIRCIQPVGPTARHEAKVDDNQHHIVCRRCGAIADVECAVGHVPCLNASDDHNFVVDEAEAVFWSTGRECATAHTHTNVSPSEGIP